VYDGVLFLTCVMDFFFFVCGEFEPASCRSASELKNESISVKGGAENFSCVKIFFSSCIVCVDVCCMCVCCMCVCMRCVFIVKDKKN